MSVLDLQGMETEVPQAAADGGGSRLSVTGCPGKSSLSVTDC